MDRNEIAKNEKQLICGHVFGYTYVKSLAERHLARYGKKLKIVINRPSMVIHTCKEPFPGWIDTISAVGTVSYPLGMGFLRTYYLPNGYRDFIPADIVSNSIIVSTAYIGQQTDPCFQIYHNSSTVSSPFLWHEFFRNSANYLKFVPNDNQIRDPGLTLYESE